MNNNIKHGGEMPPVLKWKAEWWGITLTSENKEGADLIRKLSATLKTEPTETYDGGKLETLNLETDAATIIFNR